MARRSCNMHSASATSHVNTQIQDTAGPNIIPFNESVTVARMDDQPDGGLFECDEEPFTVSVLHAPGYIPLAFGAILKGQFGKYKIVRKLGWGEESSVWLAQRLESKCVHHSFRSPANVKKKP